MLRQILFLVLFIGHCWLFAKFLRRNFDSVIFMLLFRPAPLFLSTHPSTFSLISGLKNNFGHASTKSKGGKEMKAAEQEQPKNVYFVFVVIRKKGHNKCERRRRG